MKKLRITVDGKVFDVSVELLDQVSSTTAAPAPAPVAAPRSCGFRPRGRPGPGSRTCAGSGRRRRRRRSQPACREGRLLDVAAGAPVKAGDQILTLEAMKMNTIIYAPASGTLTAFCVNPGDTVQEGQALAKIG